jgi:hypothetical protein
MSQSNIVQFPASKIVREILLNHEEIELNKAKSKQKWAEEVVQDFVVNMIDALDNYGISTEGKNFEKDFSVAVDMLRATIYRSMNMPHHLHPFIDEHILTSTSTKLDLDGNIIEEEELKD